VSICWLNISFLVHDPHPWVPVTNDAILQCVSDNGNLCIWLEISVPPPSFLAFPYQCDVVVDKNVKKFYNVNSLAVYLEVDYLLLPLPILNLRNGVCVPLLLVPPFLYLVTRTFYTFLAMQRFSNLLREWLTLARKLVHGKTVLFASLADNRPTMFLPLLLANPQLMECPETGKYTAP